MGQKSVGAETYLMVLDLPELMWDNYSTKSQEDPTEKKDHLQMCLHCFYPGLSKKKKSSWIRDWTILLRCEQRDLILSEQWLPSWAILVSYVMWA